MLKKYMEVMVFYLDSQEKKNYKKKLEKNHLRKKIKIILLIHTKIIKNRKSFKFKK